MEWLTLWISLNGCCVVQQASVFTGSICGLRTPLSMQPVVCFLWRFLFLVAIFPRLFNSSWERIFTYMRRTLIRRSSSLYVLSNSSRPQRSRGLVCLVCHEYPASRIQIIHIHWMLGYLLASLPKFEVLAHVSCLRTSIRMNTPSRLCLVSTLLLANAT